MKTSKRNRKSIRLQSYDYSRPGFYFVTICVQNRKNIYGDINAGKMILNELGQIAFQNWLNTKSIRDNVELGSFVVMPNHMHAIIEITNHGNNVGAYRDTPLPRTFKSPSKTLGSIIRGYKSTVTKQINQIRRTPGARVWQRNYYEHIIREQKSLDSISKYIEMNPTLWKKDRYFK